MQEINKAYECLSDPERRKHYDETGKDREVGELTPEQKTKQMVAYAFSQALQKGFKPGAVKRCRDELVNLKDQTTETIKDTKEKIADLRALLKAVSVEGEEENLFEQVCLSNIAHGEGHLAAAEAQLKVLIEALKTLGKYTEAIPPGQRTMGVTEEELLRSIRSAMGNTTFRFR